MEEVRQIGERRERRSPARYIEECNVTSNLSTEGIKEPTNVHEAVTEEHLKEWKCAMESENHILGTWFFHLRTKI